MRALKAWMLLAFLAAGVAGLATLGTSPSYAQRGERREERNYWRHHDGRWSHWDARDKRWYYTDGQHWFYHNGKAWEPYRFDKEFGRDFERGGYAVPAQGATIVVPRHEVFVPR